MKNQLKDMMRPVFEALSLIDEETKNSVINNDINRIREVMQREDRVIWFARFYRVKRLSEISNQADRKDSDIEEQVNEIFHREQDKLTRKIGNPFDVSSEFFINEKLNQFEHFLSLPIPEIYEMEFTTQRPSEVVRYFGELEEEWKNQQLRSVFYGGEPVIMDFGNGWAWYDLENASCDIEGRAMGHCGNAPSSNDPNQTIFSLRKTVSKDSNGNVILEPHLTFIFDTSTGMFGEMKGRSNDKPAQKYHKYIVPLLMEDFVEGVKGGGYLPENNFAITDVSNWRDLIDEKPSLLTVDKMVVNLSMEEIADLAEFVYSDNDDEDPLPLGTFEFKKDVSIGGDLEWFKPEIKEDLSPIAKAFVQNKFNRVYDGRGYGLLNNIFDNVNNLLKERLADKLINELTVEIDDFFDETNPADIIVSLLEEGEVPPIVDNIFKAIKPILSDKMESVMNEIVNRDTLPITFTDISIEYEADSPTRFYNNPAAFITDKVDLENETVDLFLDKEVFLYDMLVYQDGNTIQDIEIYTERTKPVAKTTSEVTSKILNVFENPEVFKEVVPDIEQAIRNEIENRG